MTNIIQKTKPSKKNSGEAKPHFTTHKKQRAGSLLPG